MLYHLIFPAVAPCQDSSIRVGGWLSVRNGKPYSLLSLPFEFFGALLCLPGLRCPAGFSNGGSRQLRLLIWFPCFSAGFMEGDQAHYLLCILSALTHRDEAGKPIFFPEWSVLEEDITETEEFFFSFNFSVLGEMDSSLALCALQEMQLSRLCLCHCKCSPDISWADWGMGNRLCPQLLHTEQKTNGTAVLSSQCCWEGCRDGFTPIFSAASDIQRFLSLCFSGGHVACAFSPQAAFPVSPVCEGGVCETPWGSRSAPGCGAAPGELQPWISLCSAALWVLGQSASQNHLDWKRHPRVINHKPNSATSTTKPRPEVTHLPGFCHLRKSLPDPGQVEGDFLFCFHSPPQFWMLCAFPKQGMMSGNWKRIAAKWNGLVWKGP